LLIDTDIESWFQALYCWLRTYLLERRDVAARGVNAAVRSQPAASTSGNANTSTGEGSSVSAGNNSQDNASAQTGSSTAAHEGAANSAQEERAPANDTSGSENVPATGDQGAGRRNMVSGWPGSAVSAFEAAKDIMEALRAKHPNLASELEVGS
jgi:transformation/transcription domain-associated protein